MKQDKDQHYLKELMNSKNGKDAITVFSVTIIVLSLTAAIKSALDDHNVFHFTDSLSISATTFLFLFTLIYPQKKAFSEWLAVYRGVVNNFISILLSIFVIFFGTFLVPLMNLIFGDLSLLGVPKALPFWADFGLQFMLNLISYSVVSSGMLSLFLPLFLTFWRYYIKEK